MARLELEMATWCLVVDGVAAMGDTTRVTTYINPADPTYSNVPEYSKVDTGLGGALTFRF